MFQYPVKGLKGYKSKGSISGVVAIPKGMALYLEKALNGQSTVENYFFLLMIFSIVLAGTSRILATWLISIPFSVKKLTADERIFSF